MLKVIPANLDQSHASAKVSAGGNYLKVGEVTETSVLRLEKITSKPGSPIGSAN